MSLQRPACATLGAFGLGLLLAAPKDVRAAGRNSTLPAQAGSPNDGKHPILFDRIVAWVDGETVSQNELYAEAAVARLLADGSTPPQAPITERELAQVLRRLVGDILVAREARRVGAEPPDRQLTDSTMASLLEHFGSPEAYGAFVERLGVDDAFVLDSIKRRLGVDHYLEQRLRSRVAHETEQGRGRRHQSVLGGPADQKTRFLALVADYRAELWRSVPVRLLKATGALERVTAPTD